MMNKIYAKLGVVSMIAVIAGLTILSSCRKEGDTIAKIYVVDTSGAPFDSAMVRLYPVPSDPNHNAIEIDDTMYTDETGYAIFDYTEHYNLGQAGFAVLDIEVRSGDTLQGEGIIKIEDETTSEETVIIQP